MATPAAAPTLYYNGARVAFTSQNVGGVQEYLGAIGSKYQVQENAATGKYSFSDPSAGQSQYNVDNTGWVASASTAAQNFTRDFGTTGGAIGTFSTTAPAGNPTSAPALPVAPAVIAPVMKTAPATVNATTTAPAGTTPATSVVPPQSGDPGGGTVPTNPGAATGNLDTTTTTTATTGTNLASADPGSVLGALISALSGSGGGTQYGQSGGTSLPPSVVLPTNSGSPTSTTTNSAAAPSSTMDLLVIGVIGSLIAAAIYFVVFKKVRNLKELEKAV